MKEYSEGRSTSEDSEEAVKSPSKDSRRSFVFLKEYVDTSELSKHDFNHSTTVGRTVCTYCGEPVHTRIKIMMEEPNIFCHPSCFKCDICRKPMGDLKNNMFLRRGKIHCESCYTTAV